jgi:hypothetical protein
VKRFLLVLAVVSLLAVSAALPASGDGNGSCPVGDSVCDGLPESQGDQGSGSVVTKGVRFPNTDGDSDLGRSISGSKGCKDCEWAISPACFDTGPADVGICAGALVGCTEPGAIRYRVYMRRGGGPWMLQGSVCLGPGEAPTTVTDVGAAVRERVVNYLPDAHPSFQPKAGGIVNLPTLFAAGEPKSLTTEAFDVLGFSIVVTAQARWVWTFDEGVTKAFAEPGGGYPDRSVAHTYDGPGARAVSVTTFWRAQFTVDGDGPFPVPGPELSKTAGPVQVGVREARSELIGG